MGLDDCLRRMLPKKRPELRMKIFREWRRVNLRATFNREPTDQEIKKEIKVFRERKFNDPNFIFHFAESFKDFVPDFHKDNRVKKAQKAAKQRWSKKSEENWDCAFDKPPGSVGVPPAGFSSKTPAGRRRSGIKRANSLVRLASA